MACADDYAATGGEFEEDRKEGHDQSVLMIPISHGHKRTQDQKEGDAGNLRFFLLCVPNVEELALA